jgi:hypothetical protein
MTGADFLPRRRGDAERVEIFIRKAGREEDGKEINHRGHRGHREGGRDL